MTLDDGGDTAAMKQRTLWPYIAACVGVLAVAGTLIGVLLGIRGSKEARDTADAYTQLQAVQSAQAALPACADVFQPGKVVTWANPAAGCRDPQGNVNLGGTQTCADGRTFYASEKNAGIPDGYGFVGDVWHPLTKHPIGADPGFAKAYKACSG